MKPDEPRAHFTLAETPQFVLDDARNRLWTCSAMVFTADASIAEYRGSGTFVMAGGGHAILTAAHVWKALPGDRLALALEPERPLLIVDKDVVRPTLLTGSSDAWGPDLALLGIPQPLVNAIKSHKAFHDLDRRRERMLKEPGRFEDGLWGVFGAPKERAVFSEDHGVFRMSLFAAADPHRLEREGFDYVELPINRTTRPDLPRFYGGISGAGLWRFDIKTNALTAVPDRTFSLGEVDLEGVAFYEEFATEERLTGVIRFHGRKSLYERLIDAITT